MGDPCKPPCPGSAPETAGLEGESQTDLGVEITGAVIASAMYSANLAMLRTRDETAGTLIDPRA